MDDTNVQGILNEKVKQECISEFNAAVSKCVSILRPFFEPLGGKFCSLEERRRIQEDFQKGSFLNDYGKAFVCYDMKVPLPYLRMKQAEASLKLLRDIERLEKQVKDLSDKVEGSRDATV